jgi:hypothetical protein
MCIILLLLLLPPPLLLLLLPPPPPPPPPPRAGVDSMKYMVYGLEFRGNVLRFPTATSYFFFCTASTPNLWLAEPLIPSVIGVTAAEA